MSRVARGIYRRQSGRLLVAWMQGGKFCRRLLPLGTTVTQAKEFRKIKLGEAASGRAPVPGSLRYEDLVKGYQGTRPKPLKLNLALATFFGGTQAAEITTERVREYEKERLAAGLTRSSVNAELAALRRMFNLAVEARPAVGRRGARDQDPDAAERGAGVAGFIVQPRHGLPLTDRQREAAVAVGPADLDGRLDDQLALRRAQSTRTYPGTWPRSRWRAWLGQACTDSRRPSRAPQRASASPR